MEFLRTGDGNTHFGRVGFLVYTIAAAYGFYAHRMDRHCWLQILIIAGWWLTGCGKERSRSLVESSLRERIGLAIIVICAAGQFFLNGP